MTRILTSHHSNLWACSIGLAVVLAGCGGGTSPVEASPSLFESLCADVTEVAVIEEAGGTFRFDVTVRSADTGWEKYADMWEVRDPAGVVLATRVLAHPHQDEQPFTRSLTGVDVSDDIAQVLVAARDSVEGFCGEVETVDIPIS